MDTKSLISKVASKGVLSPFEAIKIQYLDNKHRYEKVSDIKSWANPYLDVERIPSLIPPGSLKQILTFQSPIKGQEYDYLQWASGQLFRFDNGCGDIAYKGLALINELRNFKSESIINLLIKSHNNEPVKGTLMEFVGYSYVNQKRMTYIEVIESLANTLRFLIMVIDDILTLNYFLNCMVDISDLKCLQHLKMWFIEEEMAPGDKEEEEYMRGQINKAHSCYDKIFSLIIDQNHPDYVALMEHTLRSKGSSLPQDFKEDSINYVKKTIKDLKLFHIQSICMEKIEMNNII